MEYKLNLSSTENKDLISYCNMNDLRISEVIKKSYLEGFNIERYGLLNVGGTREKQVEKEVIVEKRVEIPVEVIKEVVKIEYVEVEKPVEKIVYKEIIKEVPVEKVVEIIKEVPVERVVENVVEIIKEIPVEKVVIKDVIKEVPIEKVVYVTDQEEMNTKIFQKEQEFEQQRKVFSTKTQEMENIFQEEMSKKDKELDELRHSLDILRHSLDILRQTPPLEKVVEVIKEVPVEIIKEVVIEKESTDIGLKSKLEAIQNTVQKLKQDNIEKDKQIMEYQKTIEEIQRFQQDRKAAFLKGSNLDDTLYK